MQRIVILDADRVFASALCGTAERVFPGAEIVVVQRLADANEALATVFCDLLITGLDLIDGDALDFVFATVKCQRRAGRVLVVTEHHERRVLELMREWQLDGVFDRRTDDTESLEQALRAVAAGQSYWSSRLREQLDAHLCGGRSLSLLLTPAELALLGAIGDGSDNATAARLLEVSAATVRTLRRNLHRKLKLHHRGDVVQFAVRNGFVRFSHGIVMRPGFEHTLAAYRARRRPRISHRREPDPAAHPAA
jgi:DNA-binding NarL/FixJ family response regulator